MGCRAVISNISMNKKLFILAGIGMTAALAILLAAVWYRAASEPPVSPPDTQGVGGSSATRPPGQDAGNNLGLVFSVRATDGGTLRTKDFLRDRETVRDPVNAGYYYLGYHFTDDPTQTVPYVIEYIEATQYFNVVLFQEPIGRIRTDAERYLMEHLGISREDMCRLQYTVSVPQSVNEAYTSMHLGFSFCSGSVILPE